MQNRFVKFVSSFGLIGFLPFAPGTWGSIAALALAWFLPGLILPFAIICVILGFAVCSEAVKRYSSRDPKPFVIDEASGVFLSVLFLPKTAWVFIGAFLLFRLLDILKPWPVGRLERMDHPASIMLDDLAAGILTNLALRLILLFTT
jgi:phosphatidylglycerophosphatase A